MTRINYSTGAKWENIVGYSRAVQAGDMVFVSGTTAVDENGNTIGIGDPYAQTKFIIKKIEDILNKAGVDLSSVVRTRIFTVDISAWEEIGKAHAEAFLEIKPAATMVEVKSLINKELLVEIEVDAHR